MDRMTSAVSVGKSIEPPDSDSGNIRTRCKPWSEEAFYRIFWIVEMALPVGGRREVPLIPTASQEN